MIDDGYIHWNLLRHMLKAGLVDMAEKLVTDLRWLAAKLRITGPADLLNDYMSIKGVVDNKVLSLMTYKDIHLIRSPPGYKSPSKCIEMIPLIFYVLRLNLKKKKENKCKKFFDRPRSDIKPF